MTTLGGTTPLSSDGVSAMPIEVGQDSRNEDKDVKRGCRIDFANVHVRCRLDRAERAPEGRVLARGSEDGEHTCVAWKLGKVHWRKGLRPYGFIIRYNPRYPRYLDPLLVP